MAALLLLLLLGGLPHGWSAPPDNPANIVVAAAPLNPPSRPAAARPPAATLPPLLSTSDIVSVALTANDATVAIVDGPHYQAWTFADAVPGPVLHVRQGQRIHVTFTNRGTLPHSLDVCAAELSPQVAYRDVAPGDTREFSFMEGFSNHSIH